MNDSMGVGMIVWSGNDSIGMGMIVQEWVNGSME